MFNLNSKDLIQLRINIKSYLSYVYNSYSKPSHLVIELTAKCSSDCIMCNKQESLRPKNHMDYNLFKQIVIDAKKSDIKIFQISFYGESLLYPKLVEAILYIRRLIPEAFITLNTNGMLLTQRYAKKYLMQMLIQLQLVLMEIIKKSMKELELILIGMYFVKILLI